MSEDKEYDLYVLCKKYHEQRDELLAALKESLEYYRLQSQPEEARDILKMMRTAIARAES